VSVKARESKRRKEEKVQKNKQKWT
jgi:hypothetical protein